MTGVVGLTGGTAQSVGVHQSYLRLSEVSAFTGQTDGVYQRFADKVAILPSGCWRWLAGTNSDGYGQLYYEGRPQKAHRVAWRLLRGPIPADGQVLHTCDNRWCVNPEHLFLGDPYANHRDMTRKGRARVGIGSRHGNARLTETRVRAIRLLLEDGIGPAPIARCVDVSIQTICRIRDGFSWLHVQEGDPAA